MINVINNRQRATAKVKSEEEIEPSYGSGVLIDKDIIITARHVVSNNIDNCKNIQVYFENIENPFEVEKIIDENAEFDVALLKLDREVENVTPLLFGCFPNNRIDIVTPKLKYEIIGYIVEGGWVQSTYWCFVNSMNPSGVWDLNLSFIQSIHNYLSLDGLSGAPFILNNKVFGITIEQVDNFKGIPAGVISTYKLYEFLSKNGIKPTIYDDIEMLNKDDIKNKLLDEVINHINKKNIVNQDVREIVQGGAKYIVSKFRGLNLNEFTELINSISASFNSQFEVNSNYLQYVNSLSETIIQIVLIFYSYNKNVVLSYKKGASIVVNGDYHINYLFSENYDTYDNIIVQFFKYIIENPMIKIDNISTMLIGNDTYSDCKDRCTKSYCGASLDMDNIIREISNPGWDDKQELTNVRDNYNDVEFHCKNCLKYDSCKSIGEITDRIKNALGGA